MLSRSSPRLAGWRLLTQTHATSPNGHDRAQQEDLQKPESNNLVSNYFQKFSKAGKLELEEGTLGLELDGIQECDEE